MSTLQTWILIGLGAALLGVAAWLFLAPQPFDRPESVPVWDVIGADPLRIGTLADPYAYAGGTAVQTATGVMTLAVARDGTMVHLDASIVLRTDVGLEALRPGDQPIREIRLISTDTPIALWIDETIHGDTGRADPALPPTAAQWAGISRGLLTLDGVEQPEETILVWSIADALRRSDGSIGQQGLVYSPLLRDKTGFSDSTRTEFTLIVRSSDRAILHLVFREVTFASTEAS